MSDYSDADVDSIVDALHRLHSRRHDVTAALGIGLCEAGAAYASPDDLFGQFDDVADNRYVLDLMAVERRYRRADLAQLQVQAGLEFMGGRDVDRHVLQAELDLPHDAMRQALGAEVSRGAAPRTTSVMYRSIREDADLNPEEWS